MKKKIKILYYLFRHLPCNGGITRLHVYDFFFSVLFAQFMHVLSIFAIWWAHATFCGCPDVIVEMELNKNMNVEVHGVRQCQKTTKCYWNNQKANP